MKGLLRWIACLLVAGVALELFFVARIAAMAAYSPRYGTDRHRFYFERPMMDAKGTKRTQCVEPAEVPFRSSPYPLRTFVPSAFGGLRQSA